VALLTMLFVIVVSLATRGFISRIASSSRWSSDTCSRGCADKNRARSPRFDAAAAR
jgi:hypothetical protein